MIWKETTFASNKVISDLPGSHWRSGESDGKPRTPLPAINSDRQSQKFPINLQAETQGELMDGAHIKVTTLIDT